MSASSAAMPSGSATSTSTIGTPAVVDSSLSKKKRTNVNPFLAKKKPIKKTNLKPDNKSDEAITNSNDNDKSDVNTTKTNPATPSTNDIEEDIPGTYQDIPLVASKKAILQGLRFHAMRLVADLDINPYDPSQFTRPLRLHRRFARDQKIETIVKPENEAENKEREKEEIKKAERLAQKEANQAQIAPTEKTQQKKRQQFKKKVEDVYYPQDTPEAQKRAKLRYEEGRPWHLEDFDNKNTWIGTYEEPLSETHAMLVLDDRKFRMVPLEKWYRFAPTNRYKTMNLDEAEKHMAQKIKGSRWFLENSMSDSQKMKIEADRQMRQRRGRVGMRGEDRNTNNEDGDDDFARPDMTNDADEIDYNAEDEFQDDDEGKLIGGDDEEAKESEKRIRQEMLGANIFAGTGVKDDKDWDEEETKEKNAADEERRRQKKLRRTLVKNEKKYEYETDSDHPYSGSSEDDSNEELKVDKEDEEEDKNEESKIPAATSSIGTIPSSARLENKAGPSKTSHLSSGLSLKRPGSPNLSEASGSESSRKRSKKESNGEIRTMSPSLDGRSAVSPKIRQHRKGAGSGSDTEASGNERRSGPRIRVSSPTGSQTSSVRGTPRLGPTAVVQNDNTATAGPTLPTADEIRNAIPPQGIAITELIRTFRAQVPNNKEGTSRFIALVRSVGRNSPTDKTLIVQK